MNQNKKTRFTLFGSWRSTCTHRVVLALNYYNLDFRYVPIDLAAREQETAAFREIAPAAQVPVLKCDEEYLSQSLAIIFFLDAFKAKGQRSLFVKDPRKNARAMAITERISTFTQPMMLPGGVRRRLKNFMALDDTKFDQALSKFAMENLEGNLAELNQKVKEYPGRLALGEQPSIADIFIFPQLVGAKRLGIELFKYPALQAQFEAMRDLEWAAASDPLDMPDAPQL